MLSRLSASAQGCAGRRLDEVGVEIVEQPGGERHLDPLSHALHGGPGNALLELVGLPVHLVADDRTGRAAHRGAEDGALGGRAGDLADDPSDHRTSGRADDEAALGVAGAREGRTEDEYGERAEEGTGAGHGAPRVEGRG